MNKYIKYTLSLILACGFIYLLFAFTLAQLNFTCWKINARALCAMLWFFSALIMTAFINDINK
jgi:hypothetical protein